LAFHDGALPPPTEYADGSPAQYRDLYDLYNKVRGCF
jgi:hypothetical protein